MSRSAASSFYEDEMTEDDEDDFEWSNCDWFVEIWSIFNLLIIKNQL